MIVSRGCVADGGRVYRSGSRSRRQRLKGRSVRYINEGRNGAGPVAAVQTRCRDLSRNTVTSTEVYKGDL
jgi:hypothetical protein